MFLFTAYLCLGCRWKMNMITAPLVYELTTNSCFLFLVLMYGFILLLTSSQGATKAGSFTYGWFFRSWHNPQGICVVCRPQQLNRIRRQLLDQKQSILERWWQLIHKGDITAHLASGVDLKWLFEKLPFLCIPPLSFAQYSGYFSSMYCLSDIRGSSGP